MRALLFFLFFGVMTSFAQDEIEIIVEIHIEKYENKHASSKFYAIELYVLTDTFHLETDGKGFIKLSNRDEIGIIKLNQTYRYAVYKGERWIGEDSFNTNVNVSTRIIRDFKELTFTCGQTYEPISFIGKSLELTPKGKIDFQHLSNFLEDQENVVLELYGQSNATINGLLALERANKIRDSLIFEGHFEDRLKINKPTPSEGEARVGFGILSFNYTPCTGGSVINFDKTSNEITETLCDSIHFIANYLNIQDENFAVIGIYTRKDDPVAKQKAIQRAERVRAELIALGIDEKRLRVTTSYHEEPGLDDYRDWPFYPLSYSYEIGVYVLGDY